MKFGHAELLAVLSYLSPVVSAVLLIIFGFAQYTNSLLVAMLMLSMSIWLAKRQESKGGHIAS